MERRSTVGLLLGLILMTVTAATFGYLYYQQLDIISQQEHDLEIRVTDLANAEIKLDSIAQQLDVRITEVKKLGGDISELLKVKDRINADRRRLREGNYDLNERIKEYAAVLVKKDSEFVKVQEENRQLVEKNESLAQNQTELQQARIVLADSLSEIATKNRDLESKVNAAAALRARNVQVYAISPKGKVRAGENVKSSRVDKMRVDFILEKNPLTKQEEKLIYVRLLNPEGATISDPSLGSGLFEYNSSKILFTLSKTISYTNNDQPVSIIYDRVAPVRSGKYTLELFSEGVKIGEGSFSIK
jgi:hypothetical protein